MEDKSINIRLIFSALDVSNENGEWKVWTYIEGLDFPWQFETSQPDLGVAMKVVHGASKSAGDALVASDRWQNFSSHAVSEIREIQRVIETFQNAPPEPEHDIKTGDVVVLWNEQIGRPAVVIEIQGPFVKVSDPVRDFWVPWYNCKTTRNDAS